MFYAILFKRPDFRHQLTGRGANISNLSQGILRSLIVSLPPLDVQRQRATGIETERALVESNRQLEGIFERKIQAKLAELWGENNQPDLSKAKIPSA
jgi:restriction endonuclease S subunit